MYSFTPKLANYNEWKKLDLWKIQEAICLLLEAEPEAHMFFFEKASRDFSPFWEKFESIEKITEASIIYKKLEIYTHSRNFLHSRVIPATFLRWAQGKKFEIPGDLIDLIEEEKIQPIAMEEKKTPSQLDKLLCQAIARTLWDINRDMTIKTMIQHPAIQTYGNGKLYKGKNTLRDWLSEVDPRESKVKTGRPKTLIPV